MNRFHNFLSSIKQSNPSLVEGIASAYSMYSQSRLESLSASGKSCMSTMQGLVDKHGYWSEPVKQYSTEMEQDANLSDEDRATVHSTHMNMY